MAEPEAQNGPERLAAFSDGVIAILITIMVLDLRPPHALGLAALWPMRLTFLSYALSFLFLSIAWINHHQLVRDVKHVQPCLMWSNLGFLFGLSLLPFGTAYMAEQNMAPFTVALYAFIFLVSTLAYIVMELFVAAQSGEHAGVKQATIRRSLLALLIFGGAIPCAFLSGWLALALIVGGATLYALSDWIRRRSQGKSA
ncbi:TMEM175 family protein [Granulicella paludicola]|uniref:TMEM175 family protein n=1 Tax=Granulicella paludicola TaxID=474951 RepID=UPI0021DFFF72|nr:TMEM175 family protein [Granulicella paludicola]